ncbi:hypothetical protein M0R88_17760 [Halorussus gelatinilyticus]|uniref:Uncharacterized protein n=1 Tax=Halorussus gelatinilyticus TaxID=2937524 RepID=A0A8U0IJ69_9EURY|nr:hypothetical protein [Halorussus gelatinilyticus]UPW00342.1 hypothetical protein M0R88_17760 [Halorussus gelatinilyticus]
MVTTLGWLYLVGGTLLFFFWAYGIVSFVLDCKNKFLPAIRAFVVNRRRRKEESERESEREETERQLY